VCGYIIYNIVTVESGCPITFHARIENVENKEQIQEDEDTGMLG
jgi:hypothetical protein